MKVPQLNEQLLQRGITSKSGNKDAKIKKIMTYDERVAFPERDKDYRRRVTDPTMTFGPTNAHPTLSKAYSQNFNHVDKFDACLGEIYYNYVQTKPVVVWLCGILRFIAVNMFTIFKDLDLPDIKDDKVFLKQFVQALADDLMEYRCAANEQP